MRTIVVGDVHGCIEELLALLEEVGHSKKDRLILAGDLVAKGPDSKAVVEAARKLGAEGVRGNHDEHILRWYRASKAERKKLKLKPTHRLAAESLSEDDWSYLLSLPLHLRVPEHRAIIVHGGLVPGKAIEKQRGVDLMNLRSIRADGSASYRVEEGIPWASTWGGPEHVFFGHDALRGLQQYAFATGLDTGCCYGRELTAIVLPEKTLVRVQAKKAYAPIEKE